MPVDICRLRPSGVQHEQDFAAPFFESDAVSLRRSTLELFFGLDLSGRGIVSGCRCV
jgi:hypothetical protein